MTKSNLPNKEGPCVFPKFGDRINQGGIKGLAVYSVDRAPRTTHGRNWKDVFGAIWDRRRIIHPKFPSEGIASIFPSHCHAKSKELTQTQKLSYAQVLMAGDGEETPFSLMLDSSRGARWTSHLAKNRPAQMPPGREILNNRWCRSSNP